MDYTLEKQSVNAVSSLLDTVVQQLVDVDLTLPDYCPDIQKILKCMMTPKIFTKNVSGGQLQIDGTTEVKIIYCDGIKNHFRCCEQLVPFSASFPMKGSPENYAALAGIKVEYINCRALSPRRLVIHGAFSLYAKVLTKNAVELFSPIDDDSLQTKRIPAGCMNLTAFCQEEVAVSEDIVLSNKPPIESIIKTSLRISSFECKNIPSKLLLNGELNLKMLYLSDIDTGNLENIDYILPFSHIVDCAGVTEDTLNNTKIEISSYDVRLRSDSDESSPTVTLEAKLAFTECGYEKFSCDVIADAFSTRFRTNVEFSQYVLLKDINRIKDSLMNKSSVSIENSGISEIVEIFSEYCTVSPVISEDNLTLNGKMNICIFARDKEQIPVYLERTADFTHKLAVPQAYNNVSDCEAQIASISYRLADNGQIELRCEIKLSAVLEQRETVRFVSAVSALEDMPFETPENAMTVYFAQKGESVWEITKSYHSAYGSMLEENELESEILGEPRTLLIPLV